MNLTALLAKRATGLPADEVTITLHTLEEFTQRMANKHLLDEFALAAISGICANAQVSWVTLDNHPSEVARTAYNLANACMEARKWMLSNIGKP